MDSPRRPTSSAGVDGVSTTVTDPSRTSTFARWRATEMATVPATAADAPVADAETQGVEVAAAPQSDGALEGFVGAILGFLFG